MSYVSLKLFMQARGLDPSQGIRALEPGTENFSVWAVILGDLSGIWNRDDGGKYYISHYQNSIWWAGLSSDGEFYDGLAYSNVFSGTIDGNQITGRWVDVPRGSTSNNGSFQLLVNTDITGNVTSISMPASTSPIWVFDISSRPPMPPITDLFNQVIKNQYHQYSNQLQGKWETLYDNLHPCKVHPVVVFGYIATQKPTVGYPQTAQGRSYQDFICLDGGPDGDLNFTIVPDMDLLELPTDFWQYPTEWHTDLGITSDNFRAKLEGPDSGVYVLHCEVIMYGKTAGCEDPSHYYDPPLLPGWQETGGNGVLINGLPIAGDLDLTPRDQDSSWVEAIHGFAPPQSQTLRVGTPVRVTGILVLDCGHAGWDDGQYNSSPCYEDDPENQNQEIHPVLAIDIINASPRENLTGVWADQRTGLTYYIRHVNNEIWWLATSPTLDYRYAMAFHGIISPGEDLGFDGLKIKGTWINLPLGTGFQAGSNSPRPLVCFIDPGRLRLLESADQSTFLRKLYDRD